MGRGTLALVISADFERITVLDLGSGTGSNLRASWLHLPDWQDWCLVDHDPALLEAARRMLSTWACASQTDGERLAFERSGKTLTVSFERADLMTDIERSHRAPARPRHRRGVLRSRLLRVD